ncbi:MAG: hypothetical protein BAJALOKI1v1_160021 [Promethearchaeota archaeon]|nr:MAG: hypothetical protein BAJALOKI1v1_160021 [Candidatus Lokiarchaeota archaeon]
MTCFVCKKELGALLNTYYCLCDSKICDECIEKVKINEREWKCPKCGEINDLKESQLFREKSL